MIEVERFMITDDPDDPDDHDAVVVTIEDTDGELISFRFKGRVLYESERGTEHDLALPLADDFLEQFAAARGYEVIRP
jgi:hypothetical protein